MSNIFRLLYRYRAFLLLLFYEFICFWLIFNYNSYQGTAYFNLSKEISGTFYSYSSTFKDYLSLKQVNDELAAENAFLKKRLAAMSDTSFMLNAVLNDSAQMKKYSFIAGKVLNNSVQRTNNFITINKGRKHGIRPGMGVISTSGVVGRVKGCSENFATVVSILHSEALVSSKIKRDNTLGSVKWEGGDPLYASLNFIPRHVDVVKGDSIVTTGFGSVYPEGVLVGIVDKIGFEGDKNFYSIRVKLATNFYKLAYVYVVDSKLKIEEETLELLLEDGTK